MPQVDADNVVAFLEMPQGTPAETTAEGVRRIEQAADDLRAKGDGNRTAGRRRSQRRLVDQSLHTQA